MKKIIITSISIVLIYAAPCFSQCNADKLLDKANPELKGFTYQKDFMVKLKKQKKMDEPAPMVRYSQILTVGNTYRFFAVNAQDSDAKVIFTISNSSKLIGCSYSTSEKKHYDAIEFECNQAGLYYITYYFEDGKEGCALGVLSFKKE